MRHTGVGFFAEVLRDLATFAFVVLEVDVFFAVVVFLAAAGMSVKSVGSSEPRQHAYLGSCGLWGSRLLLCFGRGG